MASPGPVRVERWNPDARSIDNDLEMLRGVLHARVRPGASVSLVLPFWPTDARASGLAVRQRRQRRGTAFAADCHAPPA